MGWAVALKRLWLARVCALFPLHSGLCQSLVTGQRGVLNHVRRQALWYLPMADACIRERACKVTLVADSAPLRLMCTPVGEMGDRGVVYLLFLEHFRCHGLPLSYSRFESTASSLFCNRSPLVPKDQHKDALCSSTVYHAPC